MVVLCYVKISSVNSAQLQLIFSHFFVVLATGPAFSEQFLFTAKCCHKKANTFDEFMLFISYCFSPVNLEMFVMYCFFSSFSCFVLVVLFVFCPQNSLYFIFVHYALFCYNLDASVIANKAVIFACQNNLLLMIFIMYTRVW